MEPSLPIRFRMNLRLISIRFALLALLAVAPVAAQPAPPPSVPRADLFASVAALQDSLRTLAALPQAERTSALDALWSTLRQGNQVPFAVADSVLLLYRGSASQVAWAGDFTGWNPNLSATRLAGTDVWYRAMRLPADARIDYKVVVNGNDWRLDPANPLVAWSGFGPNSELRMPAYQYPMETVPRPDGPKGTLGPNVRHTSSALGYDVQYRVYTPAGYDALDALPVLYVTDGHEYAPNHLGGLVSTLDNLIADGAITPVVTVFIDPRNPANLQQNRREEQFIANPKFVAFVADELRAAVEGAYRVRTDSTGRVILGTSFGGFFAAHLGAERPDVFSRLAIQSPAFWRQPEILGRYDRAPAVPYRISLSQGTIADGQSGTQLRAVLDRNRYAFTYAERNEGHAWGHWRALLPDVLRYHFGVAQTQTGAAEGPGRLDLTARPNPAGDTVTVRFTLETPGPATLRVFDLQGREVARPLDAVLGAGTHEALVPQAGLSSGAYLYRLDTPGGSATETITVVR